MFKALFRACALFLLSASLCFFGCGGGGHSSSNGSTGGSGHAPAPGKAELLYYTSSVDDAVQPYGFYIPAGADPGNPRPIVFYGHGINGGATADFSDFQKTFADERGWYLVNLHGRKRLFYDGPADVEIDDVLAHIETSRAVDRTLLFFEGRSMGAIGAFQQAVKRPGFWAGLAGCDGWCDFGLWHSHHFAPLPPQELEVHPSRFPLLEMMSPLFGADLFDRTSLYIIVDTADTVVWPENSYKLHRTLNHLAIDHLYEENLGGKHTDGYDKEKIYHFLADCEPVDLGSARVKTRKLMYGRDTWLAIRKVLHWGLWAKAQGEVEAARTLSPTGEAPQVHLKIEVHNVSRLALYLGAAGISPGTEIYGEVNGYEVGKLGLVGENLDEPDAILDLLWDEGKIWGVEILGGLEAYPPLGSLRKRPEQEGPLMQVLRNRVLAVYGTMHPDPTVNKSNLEEAELFAAAWEETVDGVIQVKADMEVSPEEMASRNLLLFGTEESHHIIHRIYNDPGRAFTPPITIREEEIHLQGMDFVGSQYGIFYCYPNPLAPERMVWISHGNIQGEYSGFELMGWYYPDYVVFDETAPLRTTNSGEPYHADAFVMDGFFDQGWSLSPGFEVEIDEENLHFEKILATTCEIMVRIFETSTGLPVIGLKGEAFTVRVDGFDATLLDISDLGDGTYALSFSFHSLWPKAFYLTVEVIHSGLYGEDWSPLTIE